MDVHKGLDAKQLDSRWPRNSNQSDSVTAGDFLSLTSANVLTLGGIVSPLGYVFLKVLSLLSRCQHWWPR